MFEPTCKLQPTNTLLEHCKPQNLLYIVSNASLQKNNHSGYAWVITHNDTALWHGLGLALGSADNMYSGRAEALGLMATLLFLSFYISCYSCLQIPETIVECYCNNAGVISTLNDMQTNNIVWPNDTTGDDQDVFLEILSTVSGCTLLLFSFIHVLGRQDKDPTRKLTTVKQLNMECNKWSKVLLKLKPNWALLSITLNFQLPNHTCT